MYNSGSGDEVNTKDSKNDNQTAIEVTANFRNSDKDSTTITKNQQSPNSDNTEIINRASKYLFNDNIIIIETPSPTASPPPMYRLQTSSSTSKSPSSCKPKACRNTGSHRAGSTIRSMSDSEQPHPDIVQKTKDIFESLARKHRQEAALQRTQSSVQSNSKPTTFKSNLPRSQSMLVLTGRAWCSGSSLLNSIYHRNGACSSLSRGTKNATLFNNSFINENQNHQETKPHFQRSCSELDKYFQDGIDDEDLWETYAGSDRGSPVSPEVIQKIRQQGSCVKFFGREASIVNGDDDNDSINDKNAYILDYPIEIQRDNGSLSPLSVDDSESSQKPKIIGVMSKLSPGGSTASSGSSTWRRGETPSPASPSLNGWLLGDASFDDLQSCFNMEGMDGSRSRSTSAVESSYVKLALRHSNAQYSDSVTMPRCHGKWMKNPYWPGSYYVVYDFTQQQNHASAQDK